MRLRRTHAFTLIETVYAAFLTASAAAILLAAMPTATMAYTAANGQQKAMNLAQKEIESIRALGYADANPTQLASNGLIDNVNPIGTNIYSFTNSDTGAADSPAHILNAGTGTVEIDQQNLNLVRVVVTLTWIERGNTETYQLATLIANL
jgi:hypothetical protein